MLNQLTGSENDKHDCFLLLDNAEVASRPDPPANVKVTKLSALAQEFEFRILCTR